MMGEKIYMDRNFNVLECYLNNDDNIVIRIRDTNVAENTEYLSEIIMPPEHVDQLIIQLSDELNKITKKSK